MKTIHAKIAALAVVGATIAAIAPAMAQNASLRAHSGTVTLNAGFTPDPYTVNVTAGGSVNGANLPGSCTGMISDAPDFELTYHAGSFPLAFRSISSADTTLIINGPDGQWYCDDDSFGDGDAQVIFRNPRSGTYDVWVGTFGGGTASTTLQVTETP
ncbi:MAG: hypothetical protein ACKOUM_02955 [Sphingopyxis sp.]